MRRLLLPLGLLLLAGCPPQRNPGPDTPDDDDSFESDDDDSTGSDDDDSDVPDDDDAAGPAPVIGSVDPCEMPVTPEWCTEPAWVVEFRIAVTDPDCDLVDPLFSIQIEGSAPVSDRFEGTLGADGCGGALDIGLCSDSWVRGEATPYAVTMTDAAGNESEPWLDDWLVPEPGDDDCGPQ